MNGGSPPPGHQALTGNTRDINERQYESWDDEIKTRISPNNLRPIGAEQRSTSSGVLGHTTGL